MRAARHYEGAFQAQVRKAVATARQVYSSFLVYLYCFANFHLLFVKPYPLLFVA